MCEQYKNIAEFQNATVAMVYDPIDKDTSRYQSEAQMEAHLIETLQAQGYEYIRIHHEKELVANLRTRLEVLNDYHFSDDEWTRFFDNEIAKKNLKLADKTRLIQEKDTAIALQLDDGSFKNIRLLDKKDIHHNYLQVINQYVPEGGARKNRYDVTILVNGLPLVHIELKSRGVNIREAFNQIKRYERDSFWAGSGLYDYIQIFVISNGTYTKYFSNTTYEYHIKEMESAPTGARYRTCSSFKFTSYWADFRNNPIFDIEDFTRTFFTRDTLLNVLTKYCVFTVEDTLLVMRPYQIAATEAILCRLKRANNYKEYGSVKGGGYIWHTTGSGKTLTSFKTARLISEMDDIDKVIFVVDRKDLDYQTMKEYNRYEENAVNSNKSTAVLKRQLEDDSIRIIVTTIQKLSVFVKGNKNHDIYGKHVVLVFDECHRSQFGEMHRAIVKNFKKYHIFGFTGTPIFAQNANSHNGLRMTTEQTFGDRLHTYTVLDAIRDDNVLPFKVDYISTFHGIDDQSDEQVSGIDKEKALMNPQRVTNIVSYILKHFADKTRQEKSYEFRRLLNIKNVARSNSVEEKKSTGKMTGFNSIFAVESIKAAQLYYNEFKKQQESLPEAARRKVGLIYSYGVNNDDEDWLDESSDDTGRLSVSDRDFLDTAIMDYNVMFGTSYDTSGAEFENYYKDVSLRMKNKELDILIVVNMFLTGFDATTLNTLWVDKNLRMHGLIQSYSRTNRILNAVKDHGNIVCFRNLMKQTDDAIALFGNKDAKGIIILRTFEEYMKGYVDNSGVYHKGYIELVETLKSAFPNGGVGIEGEERKKQFVELYNLILRARNILGSFDEFDGNTLLTDRELQDYASTYQDIYDSVRGEVNGEPVSVDDSLVFEMELVRQIEINIDYILFLLEKYKNTGNVEIIADIRRAVNASPSLRNKKDLIDDFIEKLNLSSENVTDEWLTFISEKKKEYLDKIISEENLNPEKTKNFVDQCFRDGSIKDTGTEITTILPPMSMFSRDRTIKKTRIIDRLKAFFDKFYSISE